MDAQKFLPFLASMSVILILIDFYILRSWERFSKRKNWDKISYQIPYIIAILMILFRIYAFYSRVMNEVPNSLILTFDRISTLWYFPKMILLPFLIIRDCIKFVKRFIGKNGVKSEELATKPNNSRREFVSNIGWSLAGVPFLISTYGLLRTTYNFTIYEVEVPIWNLPSALDGLKIVQLSDIHAGSLISSQPFQQVRIMVNSINPDLIFLTGDFVNFQHEEIDKIAPELKRLEAEHGIFACLGNHDHYMFDKDIEILRSKIRDCGIDLLVNENRKLNIRDQTIQIAGTDNSSWRHRFADFDKALEGLSQGFPTLLLCHDPTNWDISIKNKKHVELMCSGHTHGGQFGMELFGKNLSPVQMYYKQWAGLYHHKDQYLYVNRGLGVVGPPLRIGINPEITIMILRKPKNLA